MIKATLKTMMAGAVLGLTLFLYGIYLLGPQWVVVQGIRWQQATLSYDYDYTARAPQVQTAAFESEYGLDYSDAPKVTPKAILNAQKRKAKR